MSILKIQTETFNKSLFFLQSLVLLMAVSNSGCGNSSDPISKLPAYHEVSLSEKPDINKTKPVNSSSSQDQDISDKLNKDVASDIFIPTDPLYKKQWHINNTTVADINVSQVWKEYRGKGIKIAVVDTGIDIKHKDLLKNIDFNLSYCYATKSSDPSVTEEEIQSPFIDEAHGTAVSGIIAAIQNEIGVSGVAPEASLVGLNVFSDPKDSSFEDAMLYKGVDISSNSWGNDLGNGLDDDMIVLDAIEQKMKSDPIVYIFAAGNERANTNFSSVLNSRYTFPIGAVTSEGEIASYSNFGTNLVVVAPGGSGAMSDKMIVTTDLTTPEYGYDSFSGEHFDIKGNEEYDYTNIMNGTSAAVPMVSGVVALMLEANKNLSYRDVKDILIKTSKKIDSTDSSWHKNGAGHWYSKYYGFGLVNAARAVEMAKKYNTLAKEELFYLGAKDINLTIPDNDDSGVEIGFEIEEDMVVEYVRLSIKTDHEYCGDLKIELKSPSLTKSTLADGRQVMKDRYFPWSFASIEFYEEHMRGKWVLNIADLMKNHTGRLMEAKITFYGYKNDK